MRRINLYIPEQQSKKLEAFHKKTGLSVAEHIRRALDKYIEDVEAKEKERK